MSNLFGNLSRRILERDDAAIESIALQRPLARVLAFTGRSIDDVINDPIARNQVRGYFKLSRQIERWNQITELEKQWNGR
jgi:hypothetical protein